MALTSTTSRTQSVLILCCLKLEGGFHLQSCDGKWQGLKSVEDTIAAFEYYRCAVSAALLATFSAVGDAELGKETAF